MIVIAKRQGILYLRFKVNGKEVKRSTSLQDTKENRAYLRREIIPEVARGIIEGRFGKAERAERTLGYYINEYLREMEDTRSYYHLQRIVAKRIEPWSQTPISQITPAFIRSWIEGLGAEVCSTSVRNYSSAFRGILRLAVLDEVIERNPFEVVKLPKKRKVEVTPFSKEEVATILAHATGKARLYLAVAFYTGMRTGEILGLKWSDIDLEREAIHIRRAIKQGVVTTTKTSSGLRVIPLFGALKPYLEEATKENEWLFPYQGGVPNRVTYLFTKQKGATWVDLLEQCGIKYRRLYETRHTFASHMLLSGALPVMAIARILGHSTPAMIFHIYGRYIEGEQLKVDRGLDLFS